MECIYCFLMNSYQNKLKHDILEKKENDFTKLINEYKESFIKDLSKLTDVESCELKHDFPFEATDYLNNICELLRSKEKIEIISDAFGKIIDIYNTAIFESEVSAYNKLSNFIYNNCDLMVAPQKYLSKPLFRSRKDGDYPKKEENQYFHKPFSMRNEIGAQRFSLSGIPMLYCSENIRTTLKELNEDRLNSVNTALFFWSPKEYRAIKVFDLTNRLFANIEMEIFEINELNNNCSFDNTSFVKKSNIDKLISSFIFCQILQFPTSGSDKDKYIQEYKLPQMVMEFIKAQNKYVAVKYESTRQYADNKFNESHINNYCFSVPYDETYDMYNEDFKSNFLIVLSNDVRNIELSELNSKFDEYRKIPDGDIHFIVHQLREFIRTEKQLFDEQIIQEDIFKMEVNMIYALLMKLGMNDERIN